MEKAAGLQAWPVTSGLMGGKRRPETTTSERELIASLATGGRVLPLSALAAWRKHGLLPPLESYGTGAGRAYYWRDPEIGKRAGMAFDLMARHCQVDMALCGLWLRGFSVPAAKLRRAWRQCHRMRKRWMPPLALPEIPSRPATGGNGALVVQATRMLARALPPDRRVAALVEQAAAKLGRAGGCFDAASGAQLWPLLQMAGMALESSALLDEMNDAKLQLAQRYLRLAAGLLGDCAGDASAWDDWLADAVGPPLALVILAMLRSGQAKTLEAMAAPLEAPGRRRAPAQTPLYRITA